MLNKYAKSFFSTLFSPIARFLLRLGISANWVTVIGTIGVVTIALTMYPNGILFWGTVSITVFIFSDVIDGLMARISGQSTPWGAFLDSTLDRFQDSAIFLGISLWYFGAGDNGLIATTSLICMALGLIVSYVRAKAEALGYRAAVGIAERPERMVSTLVFTGFTGLGLPPIYLTIVLIALAIASAITIGQRIHLVWSQVRAESDVPPSDSA